MPGIPDLGIDPGVALLGAFVVGILLGALVCAIPLTLRIGRLRTRNALLDSEVRNQQELEAEREDLLRVTAENLSVGLERTAARSMRTQGEMLLQLAEAQLQRHQDKAQSGMRERQQAIQSLVQPLADTLQQTREQIAKIENERREAFGSLQQHLTVVAEGQKDLQTETRNLVGALRRPEVRGRWGEITLRRVVELAGMKEHCDFDTQTQVSGPGGRLRPDMIVRLPDERILVIDVKTPLDAYLDANAATDEDTRANAMARHLKIMRERIRELSGKEYWSQFRHSPEFVVMFVPGDQFLSAALDLDNSLQENAMRQRVLMATPTTLVGLLKVIAYGWGEVTLAKNAETIRELAEQLHRRLGTFTAHLERVGRHLGNSVDAYNRAVGSYERNVMPGARRFGELGVPVTDEPESPLVLQEQVRRPQGNTDEQDPDRAEADESAEDEPPATEPAGGK